MVDRGATSWGYAVAMTLVVGVSLLFGPSVSADPDAAYAVETFIDGRTVEVQCTAAFSADEVALGRLLGYDTVRLEDGNWLTGPGRPLLPAKLLRIALPAGMAVTGVRVVDAETAEIAGQYVIFPAQPARRVSDTRQEVGLVGPDPETYASRAAYPGRLAEFTHQSDLAGQAIAFVRLYPVQYVPAEQRLTLHTSITFVLEGVDGYECGDYLPVRISERGRADCERTLRDMVVNPADVELRPPANPPIRLRGVDPGQYDYVIITKTSWIDDFQSLANWKTRRGTRATIVDRDWVYSEYSGSSNPAKLRAFVEDAHNTWGTTHFLLGGDTDTIPYHTRTISGDSIPNDTYYSDYDEDWFCELHVGRASVRDTGAISTFIGKVLTYEQNPPLSDYAKTAAFFGFDLYTYGSGEGENCKEDIKDRHIPSAWTYRREYDSEGGSHESDVIGYLNQGNNLVNHIDHSSTTVMGVGSVNHGDHLDNSDMSNLYNGDRQSILYTIGCWACNYQSTTCIGEAFVRNTSGGGLAFVGNSRYGWYNPYIDNTLSMRYDRFFFRSLFMFDFYRLGNCFSRQKNYAFYSGNTHEYIFTELTLLGDPDLWIWTEDPEMLVVSHDATLPAGWAPFMVHVEDGWGDVEDATVCLWKGDEVYLVDTTNASGNVLFAPGPGSVGTMFVTVTKWNYIPYLSSAEVVEAQYTLTVDVAGDGSVVRNPDQGTYSHGQTVELTANAEVGWTFDHWSGDLSGSNNPDQITMDGDKTVTAHFTQDEYTLTVNIVGSGLVSKLPDQATYTYGQVVELTANADVGWGFDHWSGDLSGSNNPDQITMDGDKTVTAHFTQDEYTLTVNIVGSGLVSKLPDQSTYTYGQVVELTANADVGWGFDHWSGDLSGSDNPDQITMDGDKTVTAHFTQDQYTLTVNIVGSGLVSKLPDQATYTYGQVVELSADADGGWTFDHWSGDLSGSNNPDQITMDGDKTVTAHFVEEDDCPEDLSGDGQVGLEDLSALLANYGATGVGPEEGDFDGDGDVDLSDLSQLLAVYGEDCPTR